MSRTLLFFKIVAASILLAIVYGLIQDQITIRICPEYFTIFHPNPLQIEDITLLALFWGVAARVRGWGPRSFAYGSGFQTFIQLFQAK